MAALNQKVIESAHWIDVAKATDDDVPDSALISKWLCYALDLMQIEPSEVSVRIVDTEEITQLNLQYRNKPAMTNVLSFECELQIDDNRKLLGDIVICAQVVHEESSSFGKSYESRFAHMLIHGLLHLLGHDHLQDEQRNKMELLEAELLAGLGFDNPYESES